MQNDANMSDSQFMRFQTKAQDKMKKHVDNLDKDLRIKTLKKRFESKKNHKKTFWDRLLKWLKLK